MIAVWGFIYFSKRHTQLPIIPTFHIFGLDHAGAHLPIKDDFFESYNHGSTHNIRFLGEGSESEEAYRIEAKPVSREHGHPHPHIAQLLGFPWSGQGDIQRAIHDLTRTSTAINYGMALMAPDGDTFEAAYDSVPLYEDDEGKEGPYAFSSVLPWPSTGYVLARTYCAGHCVACWPKDYVKSSVKQWLFECGIGMKYHKRTGWQQPTYYNTTELVQKNIHLIRSPFTNILARFQSEYGLFWQYNQTEMMEEYPLTKNGFLRWCRDFDDNVEHGRRRQIEQAYYLTTRELRDLARRVPCHTDFFRYIQWHNFAFEAHQGEFKNKPMKLIYYEDMVANPESVIPDVIDFLNLEALLGIDTPDMVADELDIRNEAWTDKEYDDVKRYVELLSSRSTWLHLQRYFPK